MIVRSYLSKSELQWFTKYIFKLLNTKLLRLSDKNDFNTEKLLSTSQEVRGANLKLAIS